MLRKSQQWQKALNIKMQQTNNLNEEVNQK
jgi:hypothetical protein